VRSGVKELFDKPSVDAARALCLLSSFEICIGEISQARIHARLAERMEMDDGALPFELLVTCGTLREFCGFGGTATVLPASDTTLQSTPNADRLSDTSTDWFQLSDIVVPQNTPPAMIARMDHLAELGAVAQQLFTGSLQTIAQETATEMMTRLFRAETHQREHGLGGELRCFYQAVNYSLRSVVHLRAGNKAEAVHWADMAVLWPSPDRDRLISLPFYVPFLTLAAQVHWAVGDEQRKRRNATLLTAMARKFKVSFIAQLLSDGGTEGSCHSAEGHNNAEDNTAATDMEVPDLFNGCAELMMGDLVGELGEFF